MRICAQSKASWVVLPAGVAWFGVAAVRAPVGACGGAAARIAWSAWGGWVRFTEALDGTVVS